MENKTVLIAVPTFENIMPDTFKSIYDLAVPDGVDTCFDFVRGYTVAMARNRIVQMVREYGTDYVLMVDNDVVLPEDALSNLMEHDVGVCLGSYMHRTENSEKAINTNVCKLGQFNYLAQVSGKEMRAFRDKGVKLLQVKGGGLGCALIKAEVFDELEVPYFAWRTYDSGHTLSEDLHFSEQCAAAGIDIYADPRVMCGHTFRFVKPVG